MKSLAITLVVLSYLVYLGWDYYGVLEKKAIELSTVNARKEAEKISKDANREAITIINNAHQQAREIITKAQMTIGARSNEYREPLIRLIIENASRYGLQAERQGDFVRVSVAEGARK